jgi:hypothetical protein
VIAVVRPGRRKRRRGQGVGAPSSCGSRKEFERRTTSSPSRSKSPCFSTPLIWLTSVRRALDSVQTHAAKRALPHGHRAVRIDAHPHSSRARKCYADRLAHHVRAARSRRRGIKLHCSSPRGSMTRSYLDFFPRAVVEKGEPRRIEAQVSEEARRSFSARRAPASTLRASRPSRAIGLDRGAPRGRLVPTAAGGLGGGPEHLGSAEVSPNQKV